MVQKQKKVNLTAEAGALKVVNKTANTSRLVQKQKNLTKATLNIIKKDSSKVEDKLKDIENKFLREDSSSAVPMETEHLKDT